MMFVTCYIYVGFCRYVLACWSAGKEVCVSMQRKLVITECHGDFDPLLLHNLHPQFSISGCSIAQGILVSSSFCEYDFTELDFLTCNFQVLSKSKTGWTQKLSLHTISNQPFLLNSPFCLHTAPLTTFHGFPYSASCMPQIFQPYTGKFPTVS